MVTLLAVLSAIVCGLCIVSMARTPLERIPVRVDKRRR